MPRSSYAIYWNDGDGPRRAGKLELAPLHALLSAGKGGRVALAFDEIAAVDYSRGELEVRRRRGDALRIGSLDAPGALLELATRMAERVFGREPASAT